MTMEKPAKIENPSLVVELKNVCKVYSRSSEQLTVLDNLCLEIRSGAFEALMGPSGSGKSTLLHIMAGLDRPTSGFVHVAGDDLSQLNDDALADWRSTKIGYVFQTFNLIPVLTAAQNVEVPLLLTELSREERRKRVEIALRVVGLEDRKTHLPRQLSGGQEQRVAIARAIVHDPELLLVDEPTGNLDRTSAHDVLEILERFCREMGKTIIMVTHDPAAAERASVTRHLNKGKLA